ncbi:MAG: TrkH family potassium uptake protein [Synergistaceae bacterium]|uniref:TrkH family potassium uptake protein n=1 Tax=Aminivibrio sp. TaxID=1872489 RepID=UPI00345E2816|nr:TrkH family potassium uptake protein [Synergistaceae bacterium]MDD3688808.1 TrkH family potassium uptake protein [Synergistaceae bacterium]MDD4022195.1 TrkH family potassium uptake protein [Synergistaceae bacterium]
MHLRLVAKVLSLLSAIVSLSMIWPLAWSLRDGSGDIRSFLVSIILGLIFSSLLFFGGRNADYDDLGIKDGFIVVSLSWIIASAVGALPYYFYGSVPSFADAFFEAMSGFTTTGASVISNIEGNPRGILFWRDLTHWLGGMGIIVLSLAILPFIGVGGMQLYKAEVPGPIPEKMTPRIQQTALYLWGVYVLLSVVETVFLLLGGMSVFESLTHTFGTMATGGFSPMNKSIGHYNSAYIDWVITIFMFLAGCNFVLHYRFLIGRFTAFHRDEEFRFYAWIVVFCTATVTGVLLLHGTYNSVADALRFGAFQVVSIITTTGYVTADYELWPAYTQFLLLLLMFLGACAGSTGGGMKNLRIMVLARHVRAELASILHPKAVVQVRVGGKVAGKDIITSVTSFFILYIAIFTAGTLFMTALDLDIVTSLSSVAATLGNIGPGLGGVGPMRNYAEIPEAGKWVLSLLMLMGRLELYTVVLLFVPDTWKR